MIVKGLLGWYAHLLKCFREKRGKPVLPFTNMYSQLTLGFLQVCYKCFDSRRHISNDVFSISNVVMKSTMICWVFFSFLVDRIILFKKFPPHLDRKSLTSFKVHIEWKFIKILWLNGKLS